MVRGLRTFPTWRRHDTSVIESKKQGDITHAARSATLIGAQKNPYADFFHWELSNGHVIVDICDTYAEHDEGLGLGNFPLTSAPLPHPFCPCLWYVDTNKTLDQVTRKLGR